MFHHVSRRSTFQDWIQTAIDLDPKYDYYNFANTVLKDKTTTSSLYITLMNDTLMNAPKKRKPEIIKAIVLFNKKNSKGSHFYSSYEEYWRVRDEDEINLTTRRIEKRARDTVESVADNVFNSIVDSSKRLCNTNSNSNSNRDSDSISDSVNDSISDSVSDSINDSISDSISDSINDNNSNSSSNSNSISISNSNSDIDNNSNINNSSNSNNSGTILTDITLTYKEMTGLQILYIDDDGVKIMLEQELLEDLRQRTTLENEFLSSSATDILSHLNRTNPDFYTYRSIIKRFNLPDHERFDIVTHADLNFIETMGNHFLNLNQSPSNPLLLPTLERTAAIHTTIALLNNLFLSVNDKINFNWIEIETLLTQSTKWDGVGFHAGLDKKIGFCLVEFSGGIKKNCRQRKAGSDEKKIEKGIISFIEYTNAVKGHFIRFHDMRLYFELVFLVDDQFIRRTHVTVKLPTTPSELKDFFNQTDSLFAWKKSLIDSLQLY